MHGVEQRLPDLTSGEASWECAFDHYRPVCGEVPVRDRWDDNPLHRREYLLRVVRRVDAG